MSSRNDPRAQRVRLSHGGKGRALNNKGRIQDMHTEHKLFLAGESVRRMRTFKDWLKSKGAVT
jgi:hypothetical protein